MPGFGDRFQIDVLVSDLNSKPWVSSVNNITWPASVQTVLQQIAKVQTGSILLNGIGSASKWMMIIPPLPNAPMQINADTFPLSGAPLAWAPNHKYFAYIEYDPRVFTPMFVPPGIPRFTGMPDEVLFHELVHAFRILTGALGKGTPIKPPMKYSYDTSEEFFAIVLANIYASDVTNPSGSGLRVNHHSHFPLDPAVASSVRFFKAGPQVLPLLREFAARHPDLAKQLCGVKASFNPIRALFDPSLTRLLKAMSISADASDRAFREALLTAARDIFGYFNPTPVPPDLDKIGRMAVKGGVDLGRQALAVLGL